MRKMVSLKEMVVVGFIRQGEDSFSFCPMIGILRKVCRFRFDIGINENFLSRKLEENGARQGLDDRDVILGKVRLGYITLG